MTNTHMRSLITTNMIDDDVMIKEEDDEQQRPTHRKQVRIDSIIGEAAYDDALTLTLPMI